MKEMESLRQLIKTLRSEKGCPWDREQTIEDLREYFLEECHEVADSIDSGDSKELCEELGDLLFQIVFAAELYEEKGIFKLEDVCQGIQDKMVSRHPHVFSDAKVKDTKEVLVNWNEMKKQEKKERISLLDGLPRSLPALKRAEKIQKKASKVGFDWKKTEEVTKKVYEEWEELQEALMLKDPEKITEEFGDILFSLVNLSRFIGVDSDHSLRKTVDKFESRFRFVEEKVKHSGKEWEEYDLEALDKFWDQAKEQGKLRNKE